VLVEELRMHLAWRWFTGQGFDQEIPHNSTFSQTDTNGFRNRSYSTSCLNTPDTTYGNGESQQWLLERDIAPYI